MEKPFDPYYLWLGIPPAEQPPHHYRLLGLTLFESDPAVIVEAADRHMAYVQTFKLGKRGPESQRLLNELSQARLCLTNAEKKKAYDAALMETSGGPFPRERPNAASSVDEAYPSSERSTSAVGIAPMIVFPPHRFSAALPSDDPSSGELGRSRLEVSPNEDGNRDALAGPLRNGTESVPASPSARRTLGQTLRQPFAAGIVAAMLAPVIALMLTPRSHRSTDALVAPPLAEATGERESGVALMREAEKEPAPQRMVRVDGSQINAAPGPTSAPPAVVEATVRLSVNVAPQPGVIAGQRRNLRRAAAMISTQTAKLGTELAPDFVLADRTAWLAGESRFPDPPAFAPAKPAGWDVPPDADLAKARVTVKERFGEELAEARRFGNADDVAYRMAAAAQRGEPPPDMVYALLERAREAVVSVDADSPKMIWRLWDAAGARFNIDCTAEKLSTLRTLETRAESLLAAESTERAAIESERVCYGWLSVAADAVRIDDFAAADQRYESATRWARLCNDDLLTAAVERRQERAKALSAAFAESTAARDEAEHAFDDDAAAATSGRYLCLAKEDFPAGLPSLARGVDQAANAARRELAPAKSNAERLVRGDLWWDAAEAEHDSLAKAAAWRRAAAWYRSGLTDARESLKPLVEARLALVEIEHPMAPIGEWCDLLPHVDPIRHALEGEWKCDDSRLVAASNARPAVLAVPLIPTGAYEIDVTFTPGFDRVPVQLYRNEMQYKNRFHDFRLTLPLGETFIKLGVVKDASSDFVRALLDGENKPLKFPGAWSRFRVHPYENPAASRLRVRVIPQGERASVEVWSDRKRLVRWEGLLRDLPQFGDADSEPRCLRIESPDGGCEVYELELRPLSGTVRLGVQ